MSEEFLDTLEEVDKNFLDCREIFSYLRDTGVTAAIRRYQEGYALKGENPLRQRLLSQVRILTK
jgi:hypothetical protein